MPVSIYYHGQREVKHNSHISLAWKLKRNVRVWNYNKN